MRLYTYIAIMSQSIPTGHKNDGRIPNFSQIRGNCSLSLQKSLKIKKTTRQYNFLFGELNETFIF